MNKFLLIIQREFTIRVKKKSFIILTILMPFIFAALVFVPIWLASIEDDEQKTVALHDATGVYAGESKDDAANRFVPIADPNNSAYYSDTTSVEAVIVIQKDLTKKENGVTIFSHKEVAAGLLSYVENVLNERVRRDKLAATGIQGIDRIIEDIQSEVTVTTVKRNAEGDTRSSNTAIAMTAGFLFTFMIYMFVLRETLPTDDGKNHRHLARGILADGNLGNHAGCHPLCRGQHLWTLRHTRAGDNRHDGKRNAHTADLRGR